MHAELALLCRSIKTRSVSALVMLLFVGAQAAWAQSRLSQPLRFERLQKNSDDYYNVISLEERGLALYRERDKYKNSSKIWELVLLDTLLSEKKTIELEIKERHKMVGYEIAPDHLYFLYRTGETTKNDFELFEVAFENGAVVKHTIKPDLDFKLTHFTKVGNSVAFGGYVSNEPAIFLYELTSKNIKVLPGFFQKETELVELRSNQNETINIVLIDRGSKGDRNLLFRTFDSAGNMLLEDKVAIDENITLQTGITSRLTREDLVVAGTWGERNSKQSKGFYFLAIDPFRDQKINYYNFGQLNHYLDYLTPKRAKKIKDDSRKQSEEGRVPAFSNYVMPFKLTESPKGFLLLAEVYTPSSNVSPNYASPYYYNPYYGAYNPYGFGPGYYYPGMNRLYRPYAYGPNVKNSNEIKTNETVLLSFDEKGNVTWDESVKLDEIKLPSIEQSTDFNITSSKVNFIYKKESDLNVKTVLQNEDSVTAFTEKIKPLEAADEIRSEKNNEGGVRHWYGNTFYVWGYQTIRNNTKDDRVRDVFYINKIQVF